MLPQLADGDAAAPVVLVAELPGRAGICGAGMVATTPVDTARSGLRGDIFVLPSLRRRGIGGAVLAAIRAELRRWDVAFLHSWDSTDSAQPSPFLQHAGFSPLNTVYTFESEAAVAVPWGDAFLQRLRDAGRIPAAAVLGPLADADPAAVLRLYADHFGIGDAAAAARLVHAAGPGSLALHLAGELIGFIQWKRDGDGVPTVDLWISAPRFRSGWPALMLLVESMRAFDEPRGRYACNDSAVATVKIARRLGARLLSTRHTHVLAV